MKRGESRYDDVYADYAREELRRFVEEHGQVEAAKRLGVHQSTISRNCSPDQQPSFKILIALAKATHRTIDDLIGLRPDRATTVRLRDSELMRVAKAIADQVAQKLPSEPPPPPGPRRPKR